MNKLVLKQIKSVQLGDLVRVEWFDASVGKSLTGGGTIDVPVKSWGIYLGVLGERNKHIILAQAIFNYTKELHDIDFAAIPLDNTGKFANKTFGIAADKWYLQKFNVGKKYENEWDSVEAGFNWEIINEVHWIVNFSGTGTGSFWVDNLFFNSARWSGTYGSGNRELAETDEELHTDNECLLRAKALYDYLSSPAEYIRVTSDVIDFGTTPILAADRIWVTLPNENVDGYYHVGPVEYRLIAETQTLETTLELGKEPQLLADYLYALRSKTGSLSRYKIGRI